MTMGTLQEADPQGKWSMAQYIGWCVTLVFVGNLSSPVRSFVTQIL